MNPVKSRHPVTIKGACARIRGHLGLAAAEAVGKSDSLVSKWGDPDRDEIPNGEQMFQLDAAYLRAGNRVAPLKAVYDHRIAEVLAEQPETPLAPRRGLSAVVSELGEVATGLEKALDDNSMSLDEKCRVLKDCVDLKEKVDELIRAIETHGTGKVSEGGAE